MREDNRIKQQLREIEKLQQVIVAQQSRIDESFTALKRESALVMDKINDLIAIAGGDVIPELERIINVVSLRAVSIDRKVSDIDEPCSPAE